MGRKESNQANEQSILNQGLSYDVASGSEIRPCINIDKTVVVYTYSGNIMKLGF